MQQDQLTCNSRPKACWRVVPPLNSRSKSRTRPNAARKSRGAARSFAALAMLIEHTLPESEQDPAGPAPLLYHLGAPTHQARSEAHALALESHRGLEGKVVNKLLDTAFCGKLRDCRALSPLSSLGRGWREAKSAPQGESDAFRTNPGFSNPRCTSSTSARVPSSGRRTHGHD